MKIELDEKEYEKVRAESFNKGYRDGYVEAGTFELCKKNKDWKTGDLHLVCKSSKPYCPTCEVKKEIFKKDPFKEKKLEIREKISEIINKKFPTKDPQRYKATDIYSKIMNYLESF